jgi:O-antigen/teichoic acid export membrane protein
MFGSSFYGEVVLLTNLSLIVATIASLGLQVVTFRAAGTDDKNMLNATGLILCIAIPLIGIVSALAIWTMNISVFGLSGSWLALATLTGTLTPSANAYLYSILRSLEQSSSFVRVNALLLVVNTGLKGWWVFAWHHGIRGWLMAELATALLGWAIALRTRPPRGFTSMPLLLAIRQGAPMIPHTLMHWVVSASDRFFLASYGGMAAVGIYSAAYQLPEFLGTTLAEVNAAYMPRYLSSADKDLTQQVGRTQVRISSVLVAVTATLGPLALLAMYPRDFARAGELVSMLALSYLGYGIYLVAANFITLRGLSTKRMWLISGAAAAVNVLANAALVPALGGLGASLATLASFFLMAILGIIQSKRLIIPNPWNRVLHRGWIVPAIVMCGMAHVIWQVLL